MIAIRSKKELTFDTVSRMKGIIYVSIESYTRNVENKTFTINIVDTLYYDEEIRQITTKPPIINHETGELTKFEPTEETIVVKKTKTLRRGRTYTDMELIGLASMLGEMNMTIESLILNLDSLFRKGLLLTTQLECQQGKGIYLSEESDWEIVK